MSDLTYKIIHHLGYPAFWTSSSPVVLHRDRVPRRGAFILAANHLSPYDVPCLIATVPRNLDFMSVVEFLRKPLVAWLFRQTNVFFLDRGRVDPAAVRTVLDRLRRGRVVALFPEGRIRDEAESVTRGGPFKPGVARLARLSGAPVLPVVILGTAAYSRFTSWLPLRRTKYGVNFGEPITFRADMPPDAAEQQFLDRLKRAWLDLADELRRALPPPPDP